jgi:RimJ/RimL family protein N-acetyltransferase
MKFAPATTFVTVRWPTLETDRLVLRPLGIGDLDALAGLHAERSFWQYPFGRGWSREETSAFLNQTIERYSHRGPAVSAVVVRDIGRLVGWAGLSVPTFLPEILPAVEVGWRFGERHWGNGYATEAGAEWVRYGFEELDLDTIVSIYEPENTASGAVMHRLGFSLESHSIHPRWNVRLHVTSLTQTTWREHRSLIDHH